MVAAVPGCAVLESVAAPAGVSGVVGVGSVAGAGSALELPGVIVSTVALLPMLEVEGILVFGCKPKPMVSSPDSLAGVMVGAPLRAALVKSGPVFRTIMDRFTNPGRSVDCSFCIRATAVGSAGGTGIPNFSNLFFASPASEESG